MLYKKLNALLEENSNLFRNREIGTDALYRHIETYIMRPSDLGIKRGHCVQLVRNLFFVSQILEHAAGSIRFDQNAMQQAHPYFNPAQVDFIRQYDLGAYARILRKSEVGIVDDALHLAARQDSFLPVALAMLDKEDDTPRETLLRDAALISHFAGELALELGHAVCSQDAEENNENSFSPAP